MAIPDWLIEGLCLVHCSCDYGCPCESNAEPTHGSCEGAFGFKIDEGYFGETRLDGLLAAVTYYFPRALHHGGGHMQLILEERSSEAQRSAMFTILSGEDQPVGSMFQIFSIIVEHNHDPLFLPIEMEIDLDKRRGRIAVPGVVRTDAKPVRNPVTDDEHRILTILPDAWMFYEQEGVSGDAKGIGDIKFDLASRHASLARFAYNNNGLAYSYDEHREKYGLG